MWHKSLAYGLAVLIVILGTLIAGSGHTVPSSAAPLPTITPPPDAAGDGDTPIEYALAWPVAPPTDDQLAAARACDISTLAEQRYSDLPEEPTPDDITTLAANAPPDTACDWAALAYAYVDRLELEPDDPLPDEGRDAFIQTVTLNPALALRTDLWFAYFGVERLVAPPFADRTITQLTLVYTYWGIGGMPLAVVDYSLTITAADSTPVVEATIREPEAGDNWTPPDIPTTLDPALVQALVPAFSNLLPIQQPFEFFVCYDNYSNWRAAVTFDDGTTVDVVTEDSNFLYAGGPWQTVIDEQAYVQFNAALLIAMAGIINELGLPWGETAAMTCAFDGDVLDLAYPPQPVE